MADTTSNTSLTLTDFQPSRVDASTVTAKTQADLAADAYRAKVEKYNWLDTNSNDLLAEIKRQASVTDPTAKGGSSSGGVSPLTNGSVPGTGTSTGGNLNYSTGNYITDFQKAAADGGTGDIRLDQNPKTKEYVVVRNSDNTQVVLMGDPMDASKYVVTDYLTAMNTILAPYRKANNINGLKALLLEKGYLTGPQAQKSVGEDAIFNKALIKSIDAMSKTNLLTGPTDQRFVSYDAYLTGVSTAKFTTTSTAVNLTPKDTAVNDITAFINQTLGRSASASEVTDYVDALNKYERSHPDRITSTTVGGTEKNRVQVAGASDAEKQAIKVAVLSKALTAQGIDPTSISETGGTIAQGMSSLKETASKYGMAMDDRMALDHMLETLKPGGDIKQRTEIIKNNAKLMYSNLASYIDQGGTVKDIADNYNYYKNKYLETGMSTDVFDADIQKALHNNGKSGVMNLNDFITTLKQKPEWAKTMNAHEEAANYANTILKSFGLVG